MKLALISLLILLISVVFISGCVKNGETESRDYCESVSDCAPAECCHPDSVVNKQYAPNCEDVMCTMVCLGPLDCGAGHIECQDNKCVIVSDQ